MVKKYIGTSLSFCMQDILKGKVEISDISAIVTSTCFEDLYEAFDHYFISYWSEYADEDTCKAVLQTVWPFVCQPRLQVGMIEHRGHYAGKGIWLNTQTGEYTKHFS